MVSASSVVAHLVKLLVTAVCMRHLAEPYRAKALPITWSLRAFRILFMHSILGIFRFGIPFTSSSTPSARCFRSFYDWFSNVIEIVPLALLTSGILSAYQIDEKIRMLLLFLGTVPIFFPLAMKHKESQIRKLRFLTNITVVLQILAITILGLKNDNYNVISLVASYTFERFFVEEFCYRYNIPYTDLMQYCICFVEVFTVSTLKEL
ncbi:PREDICTED: uncharacterized protein LOC105568257 [Vollenhovia emeryi]|uniref:uncharacterized protein LOC105568257 n=1 Tax=Vollenhovia emeryi TaxID=411798 RepID=UPI0005F4CCBC|nr:PREDICTED: uncharacterized protein LOC105568257 [Vollenhovia emeryi]XP_011879151.1 PREDICTED: uncharacterized protein LOC105568257 [Vollenhovia emeryi]